MKITVKGQVTIPKTMRERYGLLPHSQVRFSPVQNGVLLQPAKPPEDHFKRWLKAAVGVGQRGLNTDQIMKLTRGE